MLKLTERQEKIVAYFRANGTLHKGRYAVKSAIAYECAQFFELTVLQNIGTITYSPQQKCYYINAAPSTPSAEMFSGERFGGTTPITIERERIARTQYMDARHNTDQLRAIARSKAFISSPDGFRQFQTSVNCFYEGIELEVRYARELFDLLTDQTYD